MKYFSVLFLFIVLFVTEGSAQDTTIHYDMFWKETKDSNFVYYRKIQPKGSIWYVNDFYADSNQIQMKAIFLDKDLKKQHGDFSSYYRNGKVKETGKYSNGDPDADWKGYTESGKLDYTGRYFNGKRHNIWQWYYPEGGLSARESYDLGERTSYLYFNTDSTTHKDTSIINITAAPYGGSKAVFSFIEENIEYPELARQQNAEGTVYISFFVEKDGTIGEVKVKKSIHPLLDAEAARVVSSLPPFKAGVNKNRAVRTPYMLPVRFKLGD
jgi:TonB family protein